MKILGTHVYFGSNPDKDLTSEEKATQNNIRPSAGPRSVISGLLSIGEKSRKKILKGNVPPKDGGEINKPENIAELMRITYQGAPGQKAGRYYQGSTKDEVDIWRKEDMDPAKKLTSAAVKAAELPEFQHGPVRSFMTSEIKTALAHLYFTKDKKKGDMRIAPGAMEYAVMKGSESNPPKVSRSYFSHSALQKLGMKDDPMTPNGVRTKQVIPNGYTLQSKDAPVKVTHASEAFKEEFNNNKSARLRLRIDTVLTSEQAAQGLHDQQTPSATDEFPPITGRWAPLDYRNKKPAASKQPAAPGRSESVHPAGVDANEESNVSGQDRPVSSLTGDENDLDFLIARANRYLNK